MVQFCANKDENNTFKKSCRFETLRPDKLLSNKSVLNLLAYTINPSLPGLPELHEGLGGGGRSALPLFFLLKYG